MHNVQISKTKVNKPWNSLYSVNKWNKELKRYVDIGKLKHIVEITINFTNCCLNHSARSFLNTRTAAIGRINITRPNLRVITHFI